VSRIRSATPQRKLTISPWFIGLPLLGSTYSTSK